MILNYLIKKYLNQDYSENLNQINFYKIIEEGLRPIGIFLLINFFSRKEMKIGYKKRHLNVNLIFGLIWLVWFFIGVFGKEEPNWTCTIYNFIRNSKFTKHV